MIKQCLTVILVGLMFWGVNFPTIFAQPITDNTLEKIKTDVFRRGTGEKAKVVVRMKNGMNQKGFINQAGEDSFDLTDFKTKQTTAIAYRDVRQVKKPGLSTGAKIAIGVGIAAAVTVVVLVVAVRNADWFPGGINIGP